ncbi:methylenetetrahydrofolate reductase 1 [Paramarasmius palmivorus]|uniref:Methylenetetrahydrofolate reductase 1 n=1 Tax=Paramarasmius palmivorus TaxID=297713 RepID=A0AAW0D0A2_9AGAR
MKLCEKIKKYSSPQPFYTFEFFPPRTDQGFENLLPRIARLAKLHPLAISITWGAGGTTKDRSLDLAALTQAQGAETLLHLTCTNMMQGMVDDALRAAKERGIQNILALRGDPPRGKEEWIPIDPRFQHGVDLVTYIKSKPEWRDWFCVGVAAYPDGHPDKLVDEETELEVLKSKQAAGAEFVITQLFYDSDRFLQWLSKVRAKGITIPIIPGIMPIQTYSSFLRLVKLCGSSVPDAVTQELEAIKHDDQLVKDYGVELAINTIKRITTEGGVRGVHFCTLNLEKSVQRVLEGLQWTGAHHHAQNRLIESDPNATLAITPSTALSEAQTGISNIPKSQNEVGSGELNNADSWDDFPNGRFGDFKSPAWAIGEGDLWGNKVAIKQDTLSSWGTPKSIDDLTDLFLRYLRNEIPNTPFSPLPLSEESQLILPHLINLTQRGWWTVGSQPAADAARSDDPVLGWGPQRGGYVYQKCFVEFFCDEEDVELIAKKVEKEGGGWVSWFAASWKGEDVRSNVPEDGRNAVTWGVFPGQEIVQTTIIEKVGFESWKEEAFSIWAKWASYFRPDSEERRLLDRVCRERWLVSIVHHDYKNKDALWEFLSTVA